MIKLSNMHVNRIIQLLLGIIFVILASVIGYYLFTEFELVSTEIDEGYNEEARQNPFFAAEMFLSEAGTDTISEEGYEKLDDLPSTEDTLILFSSRLTLSDRRSNQLKEWVQNGGHLITTAQAFYNFETQSSRDHFLDDFGLRRYSSEDLHSNGHSIDDENSQTNQDNAFENQNNALKNQDNDLIDMLYGSGFEETLFECAVQRKIDPHAQCSKEVDDSLTYINFDLEGDPIFAYFDTQYHLYDASHEATASAGSVFGTHLIQYHYGKGLLTVITDNQVWQNTHIHLFDHAYLLWLLAGSSDKVWILYNIDIDHWMVLLWKNGAPLLIGFFACFLAWVWHRSYRFGPIVHKKRTERRELMEHIEASARFHWENELKGLLVETLRNEILQLATARHPGFNQLDNEAQVRVLSHRVNVPIQSIIEILRKEAPTKETEFVNYCQRLQELRNRL